ncbi:MAG TPA: hypothetical protein VF230_02930 [Acidimicrobiales bacterium]
MTRCFAVVVLTLAISLVAAPAAADVDSTVVIAPSATIMRADRAVLTVPVTISCDVMDGPATGTLEVTVVQTTGQRVVTATNTVAVTCADAPATYDVRLASAGGVFRPGSAVVTAVLVAESTFEEQVCIEHPDHGTQCNTWSGTQRFEDSETATVTLG